MVDEAHQQSICVYCGERDGTTKDHVPPKALFAKPRPNRLVTVPCCEDCRGNQSRDDEYFLRMLAIRSGTVDTPSVRAARESVHRSLLKPAKAGFKSALLNSTKEIAIHSPSGIYLGNGMSYDVDLERLSRVIQRTTCGLFFHEFGHRLPNVHRCKTYAIDGFANADFRVIAELRRFWQEAVSGRRRDFGEFVFTYWVRQIDGPEAATLWAFLVYGQVAFLAITGPEASTQDDISMPAV